MSEMPERIFADASGSWFYSADGYTEYRRADLTLEALLEKRLAAEIWAACPKTPSMWESQDNTDCPPRWLKEAIQKALEGK